MPTPDNADINWPLEVRGLCRFESVMEDIEVPRGRWIRVSDGDEHNDGGGGMPVRRNRTYRKEWIEEGFDLVPQEKGRKCIDCGLCRTPDGRSGVWVEEQGGGLFSTASRAVIPWPPPSDFQLFRTDGCPLAIKRLVEAIQQFELPNGTHLCALSNDVLDAVAADITRHAWCFKDECKTAKNIMKWVSSSREAWQQLIAEGKDDKKSSAAVRKAWLLQIGCLAHKAPFLATYFSVDWARVQSEFLQYVTECVQHSYGRSVTRGLFNAFQIARSQQRNCVDCLTLIAGFSTTGLVSRVFEECGIDTSQLSGAHGPPGQLMGIDAVFEGVELLDSLRPAFRLSLQATLLLCKTIGRQETQFSAHDVIRRMTKITGQMICGSHLTDIDTASRNETVKAIAAVERDEYVRVGAASDVFRCKHCQQRMRARVMRLDELARCSRCGGTTEFSLERIQ